VLVLSYNFYDDDVNLSIATVCKLTLELRNFFEGDFFFDVNRKTEECKQNKSHHNPNLNTSAYYDDDWAAGNKNTECQQFHQFIK
jgi:hypothetical protein